MGTTFWIRRFFTVLLGALVIITVAQIAKGHSVSYSAFQGAIWGSMTATVFTLARIYQSRRKQHCAICRDTPEMLSPGRAAQPNSPAERKRDR